MKLNLKKAKWVVFAILIVLVAIVVPNLVKGEGSLPTETNNNGLKFEFLDEDQKSITALNLNGLYDVRTMYLKLTNMSSQTMTIASIEPSVSSDFHIEYGKGEGEVLDSDESLYIPISYKVNDSYTGDGKNLLYTVATNINYILDSVYEKDSNDLKVFTKTAYFSYFYNNSYTIQTGEIQNKRLGKADVNATIRATLKSDNNNIYVNSYGSNTANIDNIIYTNYNMDIYIDSNEYNKFQNGEHGLDLKFEIENHNNSSSDYLNTGGEPITAAWEKSDTQTPTPTIESNLEGSGIGYNESAYITLNGDFPINESGEGSNSTLVITVPLECYYTGWNPFVGDSQAELTIKINIHAYDFSIKDQLKEKIMEVESNGYINEYSKEGYIEEYNAVVSEAKEALVRTDAEYGYISWLINTLDSKYKDLTHAALEDKKIVVTNHYLYNGEKSGTHDDEKTTYRLYDVEDDTTVPYYYDYHERSNRKTSMEQVKIEKDSSSIINTYDYYYWNLDDSKLRGLVSEANNLERVRYTDATIEDLDKALADYGQNAETNSSRPYLQSDIDTSFEEIEAAFNALEVKKFTINFVDYDGTSLKSEQYEYGDIPNCETPSRESVGEYNYTFIGWDSEIVPATEGKTYTAQYNESINQYLIVFLDDDGSTIIDQAEYDYGTMPIEPTAYKEATAEYTYTFKGWDDDVTTVTGPKTYIAEYTRTKNKYYITFLDMDNETVIKSEQYEYGTMPSCDNPEKEDDTKYSYSFKSWNEEITPVTGEKTYIAEYDLTPKSYTINYHSNNNSAIRYETLNYNSEIATITPSEKTGYTFVGWYLDEDLTNSFNLEKMPDHNLNLYAKWAINTYQINIELDEGISINPNQTSKTVDYNSNETYTVTSSRGYKIKSIFVNNEQRYLNSNNELVLNNITTDLNIVIESKKLQKADYTNLDEISARVPKDLNLYTPSSVQPLKDLLANPISRDKYENEQFEIDTYTYQLEQAINNLEYRGEITKDTSNNYGNADIKLTDAELSSLFTEEENNRILEGEDANLYLEVSDIDDSISSKNKNLIETQALKSKLNILKYLDINLIKKVGNDDPQKIETTNQKVKISIKLPNDLINKNKSIIRTYKIIRIHDGKTEVIDCDFVDDNIIFETDKFSVYAIAYTDEEKTSNPETSDKLYSYLFVFMLGSVGFAGTTLYIKKTK